MRVLFITGNYLPEKKGGIENYTHCLAKILLHHHLEAEIAAINLGGKTYFYNGVKVHVLKNDITSFDYLLQKGQYDICHFQEFSDGGIDLEWFTKAKKYCKVFFTFHLPYLVCYKNDLRYKGIEDCNYFTNVHRCATCVIADKIKYKSFGKSETLLKVSQLIFGLTGIKGRIKRNIKNKFLLLDKLLSVCDNVFIIADWFEKLLDENGYMQFNIQRIPNLPFDNICQNVAKHKNKKNKLLFIGRIEYQKGLHLLCKAMKLIAQNIEVDVFGNKVDLNYFDECVYEYKLNYKGVVPHDILMGEIKNYDFLILPSVFTEMYPLVIIEAFHSSLPVIASSAKGNTELVEEGVNGFLFDYNNYKDLAQVILNAYQLKENGWSPIFENKKEKNNTIKEILSYYQ